MERETGVEPATLCLGSRCSTEQPRDSTGTRSRLLDLGCRERPMAAQGFFPIDEQFAACRRATHARSRGSFRFHASRRSLEAIPNRPASQSQLTAKLTATGLDGLGQSRTVVEERHCDSRTPNVRGRPWTSSLGFLIQRRTHLRAAASRGRAICRHRSLSGGEPWGSRRGGHVAPRRCRVNTLRQRGPVSRVVRRFVTAGRAARFTTGFLLA